MKTFLKLCCAILLLANCGGGGSTTPQQLLASNVLNTDYKVPDNYNGTDWLALNVLPYINTSDTSNLIIFFSAQTVLASTNCAINIQVTVDGSPCFPSQVRFGQFGVGVNSISSNPQEHSTNVTSFFYEAAQSVMVTSGVRPKGNHVVNVFWQTCEKDPAKVTLSNPSISIFGVP